ncbi:MAG: tRNA pseudouridine(54/55) synthase Pus10, partial [Salinirussus sp.]
MDVLAVARQALDTGAVCDPCLGRLVADRSHGLTNRARGKALRTTVALADDDDFEPADDCWVCEGECDRYTVWAERAAAALRNYEFETYQVGTTVPPLLAENDRLLRVDADLDEDAGETLKSELNREVGKRLGDLTGTTVDFRRPDVLVRLDLTADAVDVEVNSAFVYGRYRKLDRGIPQTEWPCRECSGTGVAAGATCSGCDGTGYRYDRSVEGLVAPHIRDAMDGSNATFHGAGREDVDARMLGTGRPFVVEVDEPRQRAPDTERLEARINEAADGAVEVEGLRLATYEMVERVKELDASKTYRVAIRFDPPIAEAEFEAAIEVLDGATIEQETPERVDHRRATKTRTREVY